MKITQFSIVRPEDDPEVPFNMVDVQDQHGNSFGPFENLRTAKDFIRLEKEFLEGLGHQVEVL